MSHSLQQYIYSMLGQSLISGFLNINVKSGIDAGAVPVSNLGYNLAHLFLLSDMVLYIGVIAVIIALGLFYRRLETIKLSTYLLYTSILFIYLSLIINLIGLSLGYEFLSEFTITLFEDSYSFTMFSQIFKCLMLVIVGSLYSLFSYVTSSNMRLLELPLLLQITLALCATILSSTNFALLLLAMEGFSLILYILTALGRTYGGITASVKYFAFGTLGSIFLFWGVVHLYAIVPSLSFDIINVLLTKAYSENIEFSNSLDFATTAIAFGFMLKLGAAPTHQWVADVYSGVHMYITAFFSVFVKFILFLVFLRIAINFNCDALLNQFIVVSLVVGCFMSINQVEIKRLLAYSSIVHVGFMFMGDATSSIVYLLTYAVSSVVIFSVLLSNELAGREILYLNDLKFLRSSGSFNIFFLVSALASSAGLPPFAGFYGKFLVWSSLIEDIYISNSLSSYFVLFISIAISLVTIYYYMRVIAYLFVGQDSHSRGALLVEDLAYEFHGLFVTVPGVLFLIVIFWTFLQPYAITLAQISITNL